MSNRIRINHLFKEIKRYKWEIVLSICLFSNLYPDLPKYLYYILWIAFVIAINKMHTRNAGRRSNLAYCMIGLIVFSTTINAALFDYRWVMMCIILFITLCKTSYKFFLFKERFLFVSLFGYAITGILNNYAHLKNINYMLQTWKYQGTDFTLNFSGFTNNSMWLSAASAIGLIFLTYLLNYCWNKKKRLLSCFILIAIFLTLQTIVWGASRSALGIGIGTSLLLICLSNRSYSKILIIFCSFAILATIITPILLSDSERLQSKKGGFNIVDEDGQTSRTNLWSARIEEFQSSPLWGIGFGVTGIGDKAISGRAETGSGWLTVLSQTGIIGLVLVILIIKRAILPLKTIRNNPRIALYTSLLTFLCLHTIFEAYMFQSGWYLCFVLWLTVSILDDYRIYEKKYKYQKDI